MNWKQIKAVWQSTKDVRWNSHPKGHRVKKKTERQNRKLRG
tara:strand:- start:344 stop:466 length:123 start_codon:yes stop_codon:yes gene_type:complete